jgi:hypothetical protein
MLNKIKKFIIVVCLFFIPVTFSGCTGGEVLGTYMTLALVKSLADSNQSESSNNQKKVTSKTIHNPVKTTKPVEPKIPATKPRIQYYPSISSKIIQSYKDLDWNKCLNLAAKIKKSPSYSPYDKCTARIIAGAIYYQEGNTDAAAGYFSSSCSLKNSPVRELLSPEIIEYYEKINSY